MTNPTSNFNWQMPTATDLVTDLPADFEVFGQAVDTSMADLRGGTTGQILSKTTNADMDFTWITNDVGDITNIAVTSPITGGGSSGSVTIGVNAASTAAAGVVQLSDSTSTTSSVLASTPTATKSAYDLAAAAVPKSTVTTAGDVIYATGSAAVTRLGIGTANQVLRVNSGATAPEWATVSSTPTFVGCLATRSASIAFTANTERTIPLASADIFDTDGFHDPASNNTRITIPSGKTGYYLITMSFFFFSGIDYQIVKYLKNGGTGQTLQTQKNMGANNASITGSATAYLTAGDYIELAAQINSTTTDTLNANFGVAYLGA